MFEPRLPASVEDIHLDDIDRNRERYHSEFYARDFQVVQAIVLLGALAYIALNFGDDLLYSYADPRIKLQQPQT